MHVFYINPEQEINAQHVIKNCDCKLTLNCSVGSMWNIVKIFHVNWQRFSVPRTRTGVLERSIGVYALVGGTGWTPSCPPHPQLNDLYIYTCVHKCGKHACDRVLLCVTVHVSMLLCTYVTCWYVYVHVIKRYCTSMCVTVHACRYRYMCIMATLCM